MKYLKVNDLMAVRCIAEEGQFSAAAARLGSSQANLSRQLASIEEQMGLKIFLRSTRRVQPTEFGEALLLHVKNFLKVNEDALNFIDAYKKKPFGRITIAASLGVINFLAKHVMPSVALKYPEISISLITNQPSTESMREGVTMLPEWDILFSMHMPTDKSLVARKIANFTVGPFASPDYLTRHPIKHPQELSKHPCILLQHYGGPQQNTWQYREQKNSEIKSVTVTGSFLCDQVQPAIELAKHGLGIIYSPIYAIADELDSGDLVPCFPTFYRIENHSYIIYRKKDYQPYRMHVVIDAIMSHMELYGGLVK